MKTPTLLLALTLPVLANDTDLAKKLANPVADLPMQLFAGARYYLETPDGGPEWGLRFGITLLFPKS
jgi:hypothetical protein